MDFMFLNKAEQPLADFDVGLKTASKNNFFDTAKKYITTDKETLLYRQALFCDVLKVEGVAEFLISLSEKISEYVPLMNYHLQTVDSEEKIHNILYPVVYIELMSFIYDSLSPIIENSSSEMLRKMFAFAKSDMESTEYRRLQRYYEKNACNLRSIKSVTVGVNLDALYQPKEAGIVSLNKEEFKSGDLLDRIIKLDFEKDDYHCIAPLTVIDKKLGYQESQQVNYSVLKALGKVLDSGLQHCSNRLLKYVKEKLNTCFKMRESLEFTVKAINHLKIFQEKNIPLCFPTISTDRSFNVVSLYDDILSRTKDKKDIVPNTFCLDDSVCCYILTGPNSGGKTVFINAVATAQCYFQLGMPIPAKKASLPICDAVFKISVEEQENVSLVGRFEKECISLSQVLNKFTQNSLVLIDEAFTSTSSVEAIPISANFINELCKRDGKCIFITHYHELCETQPKIKECGEKIGYLHTEAQGEHRSYLIQNGKSDANSYAQNIAKKYGLI